MGKRLKEKKDVEPEQIVVVEPMESKPIGEEPVEGDLGHPDIILPEPKAGVPKVEKTPEEKGAGAKAQWADPEKRARLNFGMKRWSSCGKPKKGTKEYADLLAETKRMLADGSWKKWNPKADEK